ncbi:MAG: hypothetical protein K0Q79_127 [Flavipsychrobacter sp.]|nr:hypothetical protein [Flavipsychrobacter sp.]
MAQLPFIKKPALLLVILFLSTFHLLHARLQGQARVDSLANILNSANYSSLHDTAKVYVLNELSSSYQGINSDAALKYASEALELATSIGFKKGIGRAYCNLGIRCWIMSNYPEALKNLFAGLKIYEEIGFKSGIGSCYIMIGVVYTDTHNYPEGLKYEEKALKLMQETGNLSGASSALANIGVLHEKMGNYPEAIKIHTQSAKLSKDLNEEQGVAIAHQNMGALYKRLENYPDALSNFQAALAISEKIGAKKLTAEIYNSMGSIHLIQKKYKEAEQYCRKSIEVSKEYAGLDVTRDAYETLSDIYYAMGDHKQAMDCYKISVTIRDSITNKENTRKLMQQQMQYDFDKKEVLHTAQLHKERNIRYAVFAGAATLLLITLLAVYAYRQKQRDHRIISKEMQRSEELLLNILPYDVAVELKSKGSAEAKYFDNVTVLMTDFVDFTKAGERMSPQELVQELDTCFKAFDEIIVQCRIEKIKTVGDAYLAVCGLPKPDAGHAINIVTAAIKIRDFMVQRRNELGDRTFEIRIGVHTGSVVAGIVGLKKFAYDIWGDTVNTAARLEQHSLPGQINISQTTYDLVYDKFACAYRGEMAVKNKGKMNMYFVS